MTHHLTPPAADAAALDAATARFVARAQPDVAYAVVDSPIGVLVAAATPHGLVRLAYEDFNGGVDQVLATLATKLSPRILEDPRRLDDVRRELDEYFEGRRRDFDLPLDIRVAPFYADVLHELALVPYGITTTYGALAAKVGHPRAARAVGTVMNRNPIPIVLPCHRVIGANAIPIVVPCHRVIGTSGKLTGYTGGMHRKEALLRLEGIAV